MKYATRIVLVPDTPASLEKARLKVKKQTNKVAKAIRIKDQAKVKKWHVNPAPPGVFQKRSLQCQHQRSFQLACHLYIKLKVDDY